MGMGTKDHGLPIEVERFGELSPKHQTMVRFIAENPLAAAFATASELGSRLGVSTATVVRLAQTLGFSGYPEFQQNIRHSYLRTLRPLEVLERQQHDQQNHFQAQIFQDIENLRRMLDPLHADVVTRIAEAIDRASEIVIISAGTHSAVALVARRAPAVHGLPCARSRIAAARSSTAAIAPLGANDLVIAITFWKGVREIIRAVEWASSRGIATVGLTDTIYSPLAEVVDVSLALPTEGTSFFQSMVGPLRW